MTARAPEGPKADFGPGEASDSAIPRPPSPQGLDELSKAQGLITDEWTGEPPAEGGKAPENGDSRPVEGE
ncbi:hypothetical protein [Muricoccus pecuniae]|uniref:Uncharacterized protein n=1 Tax=Muricoccus pecuniae TaxID=693023 RepID=A0A840XXB3_9PROT|nr:hypothetical protein [Roseomonas pecuniae]MBB5693135.1 hypothetical protein [Roseomonas pecuniae]